MNKLEQRELSKKLYDELSDKGLLKKHGDIGFLIWKIAFGTACEYFLQTKENEPKKQYDINVVMHSVFTIHSTENDDIIKVVGTKDKAIQEVKEFKDGHAYADFYWQEQVLK